MKTRKHNNWLKSMERQGGNQQNKFQNRPRRESDNDEVIALIEQDLKIEPACPYCKGTEIYRWGKACELQRYRCRQCNRTFNALTGTPLARLRHKSKWMDFEQTLIDGLSLRKSARVCGIATNTSAKWRRRFLQNSKTGQSKKTNGVVETEKANMPLFVKKLRNSPKSKR